MPNNELVEYIRANAKKGFRIKDIEKMLLHAGHLKKDIDDSIAAAFTAEYSFPVAPGSDPSHKRDAEVTPKRKPHMAVATVLIVALVVSGLLTLNFLQQNGIFLANKNSVVGNIVLNVPQCQNLNGVQKDWCYFKLAKSSGNAVYCTPIYDEDIRDFCEHAFKE